MIAWKVFDSRDNELIGFDISWLPPEAYRYVTPRMSRSRGGVERVFLEVGPYVGALPLTNGDTLHIMPRIGRQAFSRMLLLTEGLSDAVRKEFDDLAYLDYQAEEDLPWALLLARPYMNRLRMIEKLSLMPGRQERHERKAYAKGRISVIPTLRSLVRHEEVPVHCHFHDRTYATIENRMLATAVRELVRLGAVEPENQRLVVRWLELADGNWINADELRQVTLGLQSCRYVGPRSYYIPALLMARLILVQAGIAFDEHHMIESETLLTNLPILFEKYVRTVIGRAFSAEGYVVEKRTRDRAPELFLDGTCKLEPDILISDATGIRLVADTKYKVVESIEPPDYYQMCAYLDRFGSDKGLLILPIEGRFTLTDRKLFSGKKVYEMRIPLEDWSAAEETLRANVERILAR